MSWFQVVSHNIMTMRKITGYGMGQGIYRYV